MKINFTLACLAICTIASAQSLEWSGSFGGPGEDVVLAIYTDNQGNTYTTGYFTEVCDFDLSDNVNTLTTSVQYECFVQKTGPNGNFIWAKSLGGASGDYGTKISADKDGNVVLTGVFQETADFDPGDGEFLLTAAGMLDIFVVKLSPDGNFIWAKSFPGVEYEESNGIGTDLGGNVYVSGYFYTPVDFDPGEGEATMTATAGDGFLVKLTPEGNFVWAKQFGGSFFDLATGMEVLPTGDVYISGNYSGIADFDPSENTFNLESNSQGGAVFVLHLDGNGDFVNATKVGECVSAIYGLSVDVDATGATYVAGYFGGETTFETSQGGVTMLPSDFFNGFVAKVSVDGTVAWAREIDSDMGSFAYAVAVNDANEVFLTGYFNGTMTAGTFSLTEGSTSDSESYVAKLDSNGNFLWVEQFGGINFIDRAAISVDGNNNIYLSGAFENTVDINPEPVGVSTVSSVAYRDNYLIKLNNDLLSAPDHHAQSISLYPNPTTGIAFLSNPESIGSEDYRVTDMAGRQVLHGRIGLDGAIDLTALQDGVYHVKIGNLIKKVIKG